MQTNTMKTPLPKIKEPDRNDPKMNYVQREFNQLIDYLAELTEVVEMHDETLLMPGLYKTPSLKERLLVELKKARYWHSQGKSLDWEDVEAIINRLMP